MNKEQQIEEMAVIGCVRNPQAKTAEECAKCDFKNGQCNSYRHAEALYNAGYRKTFTSDTQKAYKNGYKKGFNSKLTSDFVRFAQKTAVKEFAEKLRKKIADTMYCRDGYVDYDDTMEVIDELLKEYEQ